MIKATETVHTLKEEGDMVYALHSALWYSNYRRLADTATEGL